MVVQETDVFLGDCLEVHPALCDIAPPHPLVRERSLESYHMQKLKTALIETVKGEELEDSAADEMASMNDTL